MSTFGREGRPAVTRTPLTYFGGKQKLAREIASFMPSHDVYLEAFAGGAAVLFAKPVAARETINDSDLTIMRFWKALRDRPEELAAAVMATPYGRAEWNACRDQDVADDVEAGRRLLVSIDQSYSRSRQSWSPPSMLKDRRGRWQPGTWENLPEKLIAAAARLKQVCLECGDGVDLIGRWDFPGCVIYVDPPYDGPLRAASDKGYHHDTNPELWPRLVDVLMGLENAAVILSGYPNDETARLGWREVPLRARKNVKARRDETLPLVPETVWLSPLIEDSPTLFDRTATL